MNAMSRSSRSPAPSAPRSTAVDLAVVRRRRTRDSSSGRSSSTMWSSSATSTSTTRRTRPSPAGGTIRSRTRSSPPSTRRPPSASSTTTPSTCPHPTARVGTPTTRGRATSPTSPSCGRSPRPRRGGDTMWCNIGAAHDALSPALQSFLARAHRPPRPRRTVRPRDAGPDAGRDSSTSCWPPFPGVDHPVVARHPVTGRPGIFVNPGYTRRINGLHPAESAVAAAPAVRPHRPPRLRLSLPLAGRRRGDLGRARDAASRPERLRTGTPRAPPIHGRRRRACARASRVRGGCPRRRSRRGCRRRAPRGRPPV